MDRSACLAITSIAGPDNKVLVNYANRCAEQGMGFILAGDLRSPEKFELRGCEFLGSRSQKKLPFQLARLLPDNSYARKNLAYLQAIKKGYTVLVESDDDNMALPEFWEERRAHVQGDLCDANSWVNMYAYFSDTDAWPRGFSLLHLQEPVPELATNSQTFFCPIQQGLADGNPDVDAIYRLSTDVSIYFKNRQPVISGKYSICPFNSQNTTWFKEAFPLLYLPSYCSFRMTDIWRSFVAQRILWSCNWHLAFHNATVYQERNEHNLMKDLEQEISGYVYNHQIMEELCALDLPGGPEQMVSNLLRCYRLMVSNGYIGQEELPLLEAWISDLQAIGLAV